VKDLWAESDFKTQTIEVEGNKISMDLAEKEIELNGVTLREVRKKSEDGHQTSIVTINKKLSLILIAIHMFTRLTQEIFFKYLIHEYDLYRIVNYIVKQIDDDFIVGNPIYSKLTNSLKKLREKLSRRKAILYQVIHQNVTETADKTGENKQKQTTIIQEITRLEKQEEELIQERKKHCYKIKIKEMQANTLYNKLDIESKHFQNIIKIDLLLIDYQ